MSRAGTIDGRKFALERSRLSGELQIGDLPRLAESGVRAAEVRYALVGRLNAAGRPSLAIKVDGSLELECQRCLRTLRWRPDSSAELELAADEAEADAAEDEVDRVVATRSMDVAALVEDELLLGLPMVPMHDACEAALEAKSEKASPFAALAGLRKNAAK